MPLEVPRERPKHELLHPVRPHAKDEVSGSMWICRLQNRNGNTGSSLVSTFWWNLRSECPGLYCSQFFYANLRVTTCIACLWCALALGDAKTYEVSNEANASLTTQEGFSFKENYLSLKTPSSLQSSGKIICNWLQM